MLERLADYYQKHKADRHFCQDVYFYYVVCDSA